MIASQFIYLALRRVGQFGAEYVGAPELYNDVLLEWQLLYDRLNATRTNAYTTPDYILPIGSNTGLNGIYGQNVQFSIGPTFTISITTTSSSVTATCANTQGLVIGMYITGAGIPANTYITAIQQSTSITLSAAATASATITASIAATFNVPRPEKIVQLNLYMTDFTPGTPARVPMRQLSVEEWSTISQIQLGTPINVALSFYYEAQYPQGILNIWPPLNGNSLELFTWGYLTPPATLSTEMRLPPGYQELTVAGLAMKAWRLASRDNRINRDTTYAHLVTDFRKAQQEIQAVNQTVNRVRNDFSGGSYYPQGGGNDWAGLVSGFIT